MGLLIARLSRALQVCTGAEYAYEVFYAEAVPHAHVVLHARYPGVPRQYWRWHLEEWPEAPRGDAQQVAALSQKLRAYLQQVNLAS